MNNQLRLVLSHESYAYLMQLMTKRRVLSLSYAKRRKRKKRREERKSENSQLMHEVSRAWTPRVWDIWQWLMDEKREKRKKRKENI